MADRTSRADIGLGPTHTSTRSVAAQACRGPGLARELLHLGIHPLRGRPQRQLAQRDQIALGEEVLRRPLGLLGAVDLPLAEAFQQFLGGDVHQLDLVRLFQHRIGQRLADAHAGDPLDDVVDALQVLDVQRRVDVDPRIQQLRPRPASASA